MTDEIFDRAYQSGRSDLNDGIDAGLAKIARGLNAGLQTFHRIQWSAPWKKSGSRAHCA